MKTLHMSLMGVLALAVLAVAVGTHQPWSHVAEAQHGHGAAQHGDAEGQDLHAHFEAFATELELTDEQRAELMAPFARGFEAMQAMHAAHAEIAAGLTEGQQTRFAELMHEAMEGMHAEHGGEHGEHGGDHDGEHGEGHH